MAKQGMKRPDRTHIKPKNDVPPVPQVHDRVKYAPSQEVWHSAVHSYEDPISQAYPAIDTDLARDNMENDIPAADRQDI